MQNVAPNLNLSPIVYNNEVNTSMDKKFCRLYLREIAFNLIPQQLYYTIESNYFQGIKEKKHDFEMSMPSCM